jgi:hypothetical protein
MNSAVRLLRSMRLLGPDGGLPLLRKLATARLEYLSPPVPLRRGFAEFRLNERQGELAYKALEGPFDLSFFVSRRGREAFREAVLRRNVKATVSLF